MDLALFFKVFILAVVQGIAEFLPISSSGHLLLLERIFELPDAFTLTILLHAGTLLSVLVFFARELIGVCVHNRRVVGLVIVGTIPTVIVAFAVMKCAEFLEHSLLTTGVCFLITAFLLLKIMRRANRSIMDIYFGDEDEHDGAEQEPVLKDSTSTTMIDAFLVGLAQGLAVLPGLSRSGTTIVAGVARKFESEWAAEFSFFLSIPVIAGGAILEILKIVKESGATNFSEAFAHDSNLTIYSIGACVSFVVGWCALSTLMHMLKSGKLHYFAYWLFAVGVGTIAWSGWIHWDRIAALLGVN